MELSNNISRNLDKLESNVQDLIMIEDSARGTMCAIHSAIQSTEHFPCVQHHIVNVRPNVPSSGCTRIPLYSKPRKKPRGNSPCGRSIRKPDNNSAKGIMKKMCKCLELPQYQQRHPILSTSYVEKTTSCPGKMCCCNSNVSSNRSCSIKSHSTVEFSPNDPDITRADLIVNELKGELQKVQHHLQHIASFQNNPNEANINDDQIQKLKEENKRLKRELDNKKKLLDVSKNDIETAKSILNDYETKVGLLHSQALKSSKVMTESKEKFCKCLRTKEQQIKRLSEHNNELQKSLKEKETAMEGLNKKCESLETALEDASQQSNILSESNTSYNKCVKALEMQLNCARNEGGEYKEGVLSLQKKVRDLNSRCKKMATTSKRQKEILEDKLKKHEGREEELKKQLYFLSQKLSEKNYENNSLIEFRQKYTDIKQELEDYEESSSRCKMLEAQCKEQLETTLENEKYFQREREEMQKLIDELTDVVKQNKVTLLQMSEVNKEQEMLIHKQSAALMTKDGQIKLVEKESDFLKRQGEILQKELEELKKMISGPCTNEHCISLARQLEEINSALTTEKGNQIIKEKIIEDQSETICNLQKQIKHKISELGQTQEGSNSLKDEICQINNALERKHDELCKEIEEKNNLTDKLRVLEEQKNSLSKELGQLEVMLRKYINTCKSNVKEQQVLTEIQLQIQQQKEEWEIEKEYLSKEREKAMNAAKFASQKLLETVADFQRQSSTQKKIQVMLTKMLQEKDEQLKIVSLKMSSISQLTQRTEDEIPMKEIFRSKEFNLPNTSSCISYPTCCNCARNTQFKRNNSQRTDIQELFNLVTGKNEVPSRDK